MESNKKIQIWQWTCSKCQNINAKANNFCISCGTFNDSFFISSLLYLIVLVVISIFLIPWIWELISTAYSFVDWIKIILAVIIIIFPLIFLIVGVINFFSELFLSMELRQSPNKMKHSSIAIRKEYLATLTDQEKIIEIAKNDLSFEIRIEAIKKTESTETAKELCINDLDSRVRKECFDYIVNKINTDYIFIHRILLNDKDKEVRIKALLKTDDQDVLIEVAQNDSDNDIEKIALEKIKDLSIVKSIKAKKPQKIMKILTDNLEIETSLNDLKKQLQTAFPFKSEDWFKDAYIGLLRKIESLRNCTQKVEIALSVIEKFGTLNKSEDIEDIYYVIITDNQWLYNQYIDKNPNFVKLVLNDSKDILRRLYTGLNHNIFRKY